jgi:hypothetical protein
MVTRLPGWFVGHSVFVQVRSSMVPSGSAVPSMERAGLSSTSAPHTAHGLLSKYTSSLPRRSTV